MTVIEPPRPDDVDAIVEVITAHSVVLPDGRLGGYGDVQDDSFEHRRYWIDLRMRPGCDGAALLHELEARACRLAAPGAVLRSYVQGADTEARRLLEAHGYRLIRHGLRMGIELEPPPPEPEWPEGIRARPVEPGADDERVHAANMESFADHWEFTYYPYDRWRHWMFRPPYDPSLWFLALDGDDIAGICLCRPEETGEPDMGWVSVLGVRPKWRHRGLGLALLLHAFGEFRRRGRERVGLGVDAQNTTGAVRLYERAA